MTENKNVYFKALNEQEKLSKLALLSKPGNSNIVVWKKGESRKFTLKVSDFVRSKSEVKILKDFPKDLKDSEVLVSFEISGLNFFGRAKVVERLDSQIWLELSEELYKSERRKNFRLLTFPHHNVFINFKIGKDKIRQSNVLNLKGNSGEETGLFKNFLNLIGENEQTLDPEEYLRFRVLDISVTGLAFQFGNIERDFFSNPDQIFEDSVLEFNDKMITIPELQVLYVQDKFALNQSTTVTKAGVAFKDINVNLDEELSFLINKALRSIESEFEGFLK